MHTFLEAAERVFNDNRGNVESYTTVEDAKRQLSLRAETEDVRYKELYGLDYFDFSNYNLVLDSTYCAPQVLAKLLIAQEEAYEKELAAGKNPKVRLLISPKRLGEEMGEADFSKERLYPEGIVTVRKSEEDFCVVSGQEIVADCKNPDFKVNPGAILGAPSITANGYKGKNTAGEGLYHVYQPEKPTECADGRVRRHNPDSHREIKFDF